MMSGSANASSLYRFRCKKTSDTFKKLNMTEVFIDWGAIQNRMFLCWLFKMSGISVHNLITLLVDDLIVGLRWSSRSQSL